MERDGYNAYEPSPTGQGTVIVDLVLKDLKDRAEVGLAKYKTYLRADNGRDALVDAYQEAMDLVMYLRQAIEERRPAVITLCRCDREICCGAMRITRLDEDCLVHRGWTL